MPSLQKQGGAISIKWLIAVGVVAIAFLNFNKLTDFADLSPRSGGRDNGHNKEFADKVSFSTQERQVIHRCDVLAAHPDDPEAVARGVTNENLNASVVISSCNEAIKIDAHTPRLRFQVARGFLKAEQFEAAIEMLIPAAQQGHGGALAYLADLLLDGAAGIEANPGLAESLYQKAVASGFMPAKTILAQFDDQSKLLEQAEKEEAELQKASNDQGKLAPFRMPGVVEPIISGQLDSVTNSEFFSKWYLGHMVEEIFEACNNKKIPESDQLVLRNALERKTVEIAALGTQATGINFARDAAAQFFIKTNAKIRDEREREDSSWDEMPLDAMKDAYNVLSRHACGTPSLETFYRSALGYIQNEGAPFVPTKQVYDACVREAPPGRFSYCQCWVGALNSVSMSRAHRKSLTIPGRFWTTAQQIMQRNEPEFSYCSTLTEIAGGSPTRPIHGVGDTPTVETARIQSACARTIPLAHTSATLMTTGDAEQACTCVASIFERSVLIRTPYASRALQIFNGEEVLVAERAVDSVDGSISPNADSVLRDSARDLKRKFHHCAQGVGATGFYSGHWMRNPLPPVPINPGPARFVVSLP